MRQALIAACCFGLWPFIAKLSDAPNAWVCPIATIGTTAFLWFATRGQIVTAPAPTSFAVLVLLMAGVVNGFGMVNYGEVLSGSLGSLSSLLPIIYIMMLGVAVMGGVLFLGEPLTWTKIAGTIAGALAVFLFSR